MFDSIHIHPNKTVAVNTMVIEKRAPTDESLKMLEEMRAKVLQSLLHVPVHTNEFKAELHIIQDIHQSLVPTAVVLLNLNGVELRVDTKLTPDLRTTEDKMQAIAKKVSEALACEVLLKAFAGLDLFQKQHYL